MAVTINDLSAQAFNDTLQTYVNSVVDEFDKIPKNRKKVLNKISDYMYQEWQARHALQPLFICTHNSRRSQMAQVWLTAANQYYGVFTVNSFSGGSKATAFNIRAVESLRRVGIQVTKADTSSETNPVYKIVINQKYKPIYNYSKAYNNEENPQKDFFAIIVCSAKDESCPEAKEAKARFYLPYIDPRYADKTLSETKTYDDTCREVAREMFYLLAQLKSKIVDDIETNRK